MTDFLRNGEVGRDLSRLSNVKINDLHPTVQPIQGVLDLCNPTQMPGPLFCKRDLADGIASASATSTALLSARAICYNTHSQSILNRPLRKDVIELADLSPDLRIVESGSGKATLRFARHGYPMLCLEPGPALAQLTSATCAAYPKVTIQVTSRSKEM